MKEYQSPSHTKWDCKYHVVFIPKRRKKQIFGASTRGAVIGKDRLKLASLCCTPRGAALPLHRERNPFLRLQPGAYLRELQDWDADTFGRGCVWQPGARSTLWRPTRW